MYTRVGECLVNTEKLLEVRQIEQGLLLRLGDRPSDPQAIGVILPHIVARDSEFFSRFISGQAVVYLNEIAEPETPDTSENLEQPRATRLTFR